MSWWRELSDYGVDMLDDLGQIGDRIGEAFHEHVTPVVKNTATWLDKALDGKGAQLEKSARRNALALDDRYQRFMVERFDPLFGQTRTEQLEEMGSLQISPQEVMLNRRIALSTGLFFAMLIGKAVCPASLIVTIPLGFSLTLPVYGMAKRSVQQQRRVTYHVVSAINVTAVWLGGLYVPAMGAMVFFYMGEKLLMITEDRSHKGLISVFSKQPRSVWVLLDDGVQMERPFQEVSQGDIVVVSAGGVMPVDGVVVEGLASIDQQMLTGEAQPAEKSPGDNVYASTVVLAGKVHVRVDKAGTETVAAKIGEILNKTASYQLALQSRGSKLAHDAALPTLVLTALALPLGPGSALGMLNSA
ncbi:MAG: hypothetical protein ABI134_19745, partial [Byssovorax sp.]